MIALRSIHPAWALAFAGLLCLFLPSFWHLSRTIWSSDQYGHGPIVLVLGAWLAWSRRGALGPQASEPSTWWAWPLFVLGWLMYVVGRSQNVVQFDVAALPVLLAALIGLVGGAPGWRVLWFPVVFLVFAVPFPPVFVDAITQPMKSAVSWAVEGLLSGLGYPVARSGVILQVGPYQLLVADACAGLQTLFTLEALGLFYMNLVRSKSVLRNVVMAILIVPISFTANVVRVAILCLITFYLGDEAGQGFLHGFAGMLLFMVALGLLLGLDWLLARVEAARALKGAA